jgi:IclR family acetate operon transcriptional repressor
LASVLVDRLRLPFRRQKPPAGHLASNGLDSDRIVHGADVTRDTSFATPEVASGIYSLRSVERTLDILEALARAPEGLSLSAIAEGVSMPRSSMFRYLSVLENRRYVTRDSASGNYLLGLAFFSFASPPIRQLAVTARPWLERLRDEFGETINLGILDGTRVLYVEVVESLHAMRLSARQGDRDFIHCTSLGKAIGAQLQEHQVRRILELEGMPTLTSRTLSNPEAYLEALQEVRERGFATDMGESEEGASCVAVPVDWVDASVNVAISLSSPAGRFPDDPAKVAKRLRKAAGEVSAALASAG